MFAYQHYVPVMRMKPAELRALRDLEPTLRAVITPILECPPRVLRGCDSPVKLEKRAERFVEHLVGWSGRSLFVDFSMLPATRVGPSLETVIAKMASAGIRPVIVLSMKTPFESAYARSLRALLNRHGASISLRISPEELKLTDADRLVENRLREFGTSPTATDLVVDRGEVDAQSYRYEEFAHLIPSLGSWRTLTCLAGSFPPDLSGLSSDRRN